MTETVIAERQTDKNRESGKEYSNLIGIKKKKWKKLMETKTDSAYRETDRIV